jgi:hypothetical protein
MNRLQRWRTAVRDFDRLRDETYYLAILQHGEHGKLMDFRRCTYAECRNHYRLLREVGWL